MFTKQKNRQKSENDRNYIINCKSLAEREELRILVNSYKTLLGEKTNADAMLELLKKELKSLIKKGVGNV